MDTLELQSKKLADVLASASGVLFPHKLGKRRVRLNSVGCCGDTPLHVMAWREDSEAAKILIDAGANVNAIGDMGKTPLHVAVTQGNLEMVEALLKAGALTDIRCEFGKTAAELANDRGGDVAKMFERYKSL